MDLFAPAQVSLFPASFSAQLGAVTGTAVDPEAAGIFVRMYDCGGQPASGVSMKSSIPNDSVFIPLQGESELVLGSDQTASDGTAIIINNPPNMAQVFTLRDEEEDRLLTDTFNIIPRGAVQNVIMYFPRHVAQLRWQEEADRRAVATQ